MHLVPLAIGVVFFIRPIQNKCNEKPQFGYDYLFVEHQNDIDGQVDILKNI